jgi:cytochrome b
LAYLGGPRRHTKPQHLGHNPLGAWMVLALLARIVALALTGWLFTRRRQHPNLIYAMITGDKSGAGDSGAG